MANRAYLFTVDEVPTGFELPKPIRGLAEYGYEIPLSFRILVGSHAVIANSLIWEDQTCAIVGDFAAGRKRLLDFLAILARLPALAEDAEFRRAFAETQTFLHSPTAVGKFCILEAGELYQMDDSPTETAAAEFLDEIPGANALVDAVLAAGSAEGLEELAANWREELVLDWSSELYYNFEK